MDWSGVVSYSSTSSNWCSPPCCEGPTLSQSGQVILKTERLLVRNWTAADRDELHAICSDADVMRFVGDGSPWSRDRSEEFIARNQADFLRLGFCQWAVELKATAELAGFCGLVAWGNTVEMGWRLARKCHGVGLGTEVATATLNHGLAQCGLTNLFLTVQSGNRASRRVAEKIGFTAGAVFLRNGRAVQRFDFQHAGLR